MPLPRILVMDDESIIRGLLQRVLGSSGFDVDLAENADQARELLRRNAYVVAILDLQMDTLDGTEGLDMIKVIRSKYPLIHVLVHTSNPNPEVRKVALQNGAAAYFQKPCSVQQIGDRIKELLHQGPNPRAR